MSSFLYYLGAAGESVLSVFGIRAPYEQPKYTVLGHLDGGVEIRAYDARVAVETPVRQSNQGEAFGHLFRYITGANQGGSRIAMTVPVEMTPQQIPMTTPVETTQAGTMRFFLPQSVVEAGVPRPTDPDVHVVTLPPAEFAVLRFSGTITPESRREHIDALTRVLARAGKHAAGEPSVLSYDPPFAIPFLRRNEVAVRLAAG